MDQPARVPLGAATPKLSICISTLNRVEFLRAALNKILPQLTDECEVLVVDNASTDNTPHVMAELERKHRGLRCVRKETNLDLDANFDRAIELARGDYCWLTSDDDLLKPGAVAAVLKSLADDPSAVLVNYEFRDFTATEVLQERVLDFVTDRIYGPWELERLFVEVADAVRYIGAVVIRRAVWLSRQRELYIGSYYGFVGMLYQAALPRGVRVIAEPYVIYRLGNTATFSEQLMEIVLVKWPSLVASLPISTAAKRRLKSAEPWKHASELLFWRGNGRYSYTQYKLWIRPQRPTRSARAIAVLCALIPRGMANIVLRMYLAPRRRKLRQLDGLKLAMLRLSPFYLRNRSVRKQQEHGATPSTHVT